MESHDGDAGSVFAAIVGDMKQMSPIMEELLVKSSKFYASLRTSASTADSFLEAFQKLADATTSSKGSTKDLGVSFTKLVMRHKSIENKLKTYLGVFTDSFIWPLQEKLEEYKKATSQLEKDHSKDLKRAKSDTKKAAAEVVKLKKKLSKKGRQEHQEQFSQAVKVADAHCSGLEEQERHYLRRAMVEERSRVCHFFNCYRPVVEQELSLIAEIENLQSILEETVKQCRNPNQLPLIADDIIRQYRAPERSLLPKEAQGSSPPNTPLIRDRAQTTSSLSSLASSTHSLSPSHPPTVGQCAGTMTLNRSKAIQSASVYGTLRKSGLPPKPVDLPLPGSMSSRPTLPSPRRSQTTVVNGNGSFPSPTELESPSDVGCHVGGSMDAVDGGGGVSPCGDHDVNGCYSAGKASYPSNKLSSRSSWSSTETSDSSGIGSYNSLNATGRHVGSNNNNNNNSDPQQIIKDFLSGNTMEALETHLLGCEDIYARMTYGAPSSQRSVSPRNGCERGEPPFARNAFRSSSLRGTSGAMGGGNAQRSMLRSYSMQNDDEHAQLAHEMKLNFQRGRNNTVAGRPSAGGRTSVFQVFNDPRAQSQHPQGHSPAGSPARFVKPAPPARSVSYHGRMPDNADHHQHYRKTSAPITNQITFDEGAEDNSPPVADPGSFLAQIQEKRQTMRRQSVDEDGEGATML